MYLLEDFICQGSRKVHTTDLGTESPVQRLDRDVGKGGSVCGDSHFELE